MLFSQINIKDMWANAHGWKCMNIYIHMYIHISTYSKIKDTFLCACVGICFSCCNCTKYVNPLYCYITSGFLFIFI